MSLQNQKRKTRRDSALQNAMNDSKFRTNRKIKLYEDFYFDDYIYELQNNVYHNNRQRLKNRANERQNDFLIRQNSRKRLCRTTHEF